jgi:hypothetical protein
VLREAGHEAESVNFIGWKGLENGVLITQAQQKFDLLLTRDKDFDEEYLTRCVSVRFGIVLLAIPNSQDLVTQPFSQGSGRPRRARLSVESPGWVAELIFRIGRASSSENYSSVTKLGRFYQVVELCRENRTTMPSQTAESCSYDAS